MSEENDKALADFFAKGGTVQQIPFRASGRVEGAVPNKVWGAKKPGRPAVADVDPTVEEDEE
jgi:hypothetical protein